VASERADNLSIPLVRLPAAGRCSSSSPLRASERFVLHSRERAAGRRPPNYSACILNSTADGDPDRDLAPVRQVELGEDVLRVVLRDALGEVEPGGDLPASPLRRRRGHGSGRQARPPPVPGTGGHTVLRGTENDVVAAVPARLGTAGGCAAPPTPPDRRAEGAGVRLAVSPAGRVRSPCSPRSTRSG
jgi:hypothetical protein